MVPGTWHPSFRLQPTGTYDTWISHTRTTANAPWPNHTQAVHLIPTLFEEVNRSTATAPIGSETSAGLVPNSFTLVRAPDKSYKG